jgi:hypothetical protein
MINAIHDTIASLDLGSPARCQDLTMLPLSLSVAGPAFLTLGQALAAGTAHVTEIDGGSVPELKVVNQGAVAILLLDGEELRGAKQNRVLNTTVLVAAHAELVVPVSCTEHGRWHHTSREFADSDCVMPLDLRRNKAESVHGSLREQRGFAGDQSRVWEDVATYLGDVGAESPTGALAASHDLHRATMDDYLAALPALPGQCGLVILIDGHVAGLDLVSRPDAYAALHPRLLRSYVGKVLGRRVTESPADDLDDADVTERVRAFLADLADAETEHFPAVGAGQDVRVESPSVVGTALVVAGTILHLAGFARAAKANRPGPRYDFR